MAGSASGATDLPAVALLGSGNAPIVAQTPDLEEIADRKHR